MSKRQELSNNNQSKADPVNGNESVIPTQAGTQSDSSLDNDIIQGLTADLQRLQAEFINYKNRVEQEKSQLGDFAKIQVIKDLLPVIDDLERALNHLPENLTQDKWAQGVQKVHGRLIKQLEKLDVSKIDALNKPFDHNLHEAVQAEGEGENQIVSEVLQNGYMLGDQVIRHVVVKVSNQ